MNTGHKVIFRILQTDSRMQGKYTVNFRHSVPRSLLTSICYVEEIIFEVISQEKIIAIISQDMSYK